MQLYYTKKYIKMEYRDHISNKIFSHLCRNIGRMQKRPRKGGA